MGIYAFRWEVLKKYLTEDNEDSNSSNDFGKNVIPKLVADGRRLFAYEFNGYWKDVGTVSSLWQANMDLLGENPLLDMGEARNRIYSRNYSHPGSYIAPESEIVNSYIAEGSTVYGKIYNSIISTGCLVEKDAEIHNSVVMPNAVIETHSIIRYAIIGEDATVHAYAKIGDDPEFYEKNRWDIAVVGREKEVPQKKILLPKEVY